VFFAQPLGCSRSSEPKVEMEDQINWKTFRLVFLRCLALDYTDERRLLVVRKPSVRFLSLGIQFLCDFFVNDPTKFKPVTVARDRTQNVRVIRLMVFG